jgi:hypothetical protein
MVKGSNVHLCSHHFVKKNYCAIWEAMVPKKWACLVGMSVVANLNITMRPYNNLNFGIWNMCRYIISVHQVFAITLLKLKQDILGTRHTVVGAILVWDDASHVHQTSFARLDHSQIWSSDDEKYVMWHAYEVRPVQKSRKVLNRPVGKAEPFWPVKWICVRTRS